MSAAEVTALSETASDDPYCPVAIDPDLFVRSTNRINGYTGVGVQPHKGALVTDTVDRRAHKVIGHRALKERCIVSLESVLPFVLSECEFASDAFVA
jgi:hypothetical protein